MNELEKAQRALYMAERELREALDSLREWTKKGYSDATFRALAQTRYLSDAVGNLFGAIDPDTLLSFKGCSKAHCECKGYHQDTPANNHCLCGHSSIDHTKELDK